MQAQGMAERKLEDRSRRTEDCGQPRKSLRDGLGVFVRPLNTITCTKSYGHTAAIGL